MNQRLKIVLDAPGERLDKALALAYPELSRSQWQQLIRDGAVRIAGALARPNLRLEGGERVEATLPPVAETGILAQAIPLDILDEDGDILVINKPPGMVVHPAPGHSEGTLVNAVLGYCPDLEGVGGERRPGIVHRLDRDTSGVIIVAKNDRALRHLQRQFKRRTVQKQYLALVDGHIQPPQAVIDAPIGRDPRHRQRMAVIRPGSSARSRKATTYYRLERSFEQHSLVRTEPHTGRTHQIRVHLAFAGYPIVGDTIYGRRKPSLDVAHHCLHAASLTFLRPEDDVEVTVEAPLPVYFQELLGELDRGS
jgi:23S rRNA pseudouridine1911/1915/1917 synthase